MTDLRKTITEIVREIRQCSRSSEDAATAIIAALPGMIAPLVWEDQRGGSYAWPLGLHYYTEGGADDWCVACMIGDCDIWHSDNLSTLEAAKSSANAHYRAAVMAAFGLPGDGND